MKSPERVHHCAEKLNPELCKAISLNSRYWLHWRGALREPGLTSPTVTTSQSFQRRTVRYGDPLGGHSEMTLALLPAYWLKQAAPTNAGETDQSGAQWTNAPVGLTPAAAVGSLRTVWVI